MDKQDSDLLTHPMLYRQTINSPDKPSSSSLSPSSSAENNNNSHSKTENKDIPKNKNQKEEEGWIPPIRHKSNEDNNEEYWDCYPNLVRKIENQGSPEIKKQLHDLQQSHSPK
ncbi:hypothetical protein BDC45DRAFT_565343 [Circinella umbellata]|nr:hypothetical protein BDC45DRAFT_565343 [Circinella umbellata]